jgi:CBS domain-containing protein
MTGSHELHQTFETTIRNTLNRSKIFLFRLTQVEREHEIPIFDSPFRTILKVGRKQIHIKKEILFPLHHGLQILSLFYGMVGGTPKARIEKLVDAGVISKEFSSEMLSALELVLKLFIQVRWESNGNHSSISMDRLSSREKSLINTSLKTLREFQSLVFSHFSI